MSSMAAASAAARSGSRRGPRRVASMASSGRSRLPPAPTSRRIGALTGSGSTSSCRDSSISTSSRSDGSPGGANSPSSWSASRRPRGPSSSMAKTDCQRPSTRHPDSTSSVQAGRRKSERQWAWPFLGSSAGTSSRCGRSSWRYATPAGATRSSASSRSRISSGSFSFSASPNVVCRECTCRRPSTSPAAVTSRCSAGTSRRRPAITARPRWRRAAGRAAA